ncbi:MAG: alpha/beta hydrolase [Acidobacteriaceae bacterium]
MDAKSAIGTMPAFHPTNVELETMPLTLRGGQELIRALSSEQGFAARPLPMGGKGIVLRANGDLSPDANTYQKVLYAKGTSVGAGDRIVITKLIIHGDRIQFDLNGGPDYKHKYLRHVSIGMDPYDTAPVVQDDGLLPTGARVTLQFQKYVPGLRDPALRQRNFDLFAQSLLNEVIPMVESMYLVLPGRDNRAIAGQSVGGAETLLTGLNHRNTFGWVSAFSPGGVGADYAREFPSLVPGTGSQGASVRASAAPLRLLWISCGTEDDLIASKRRLVAWIKSQNVPVMSIETPGMHTWMVWRDNLVHFAPLLFQPK